MTEDYRDICGDSRPEDLTAAEDRAPSVPWSTVSRTPSSMDSLRDPDSDFESTVARREIERGSIQLGKREIKMYPQQFVYNFPEIQTRGYRVGLNRPTSAASSLRQPPSMNPSDYKSIESIKNVIDLQDPLRFTAGKIFQAPNYEVAGSPEQEQLQFPILNSKNLLDPDLPSGIYPLTRERDPKLSIFIRPTLNWENFIFRRDGYLETVKYPRCQLTAKSYYELGTPADQVNYPESPLFKQGNEYLKSLFPDEGKTFEETRFKTFAAFHKSELDYMETFPKFYAEAKVVAPKREAPVDQVYSHEDTNIERQNGYYQVNSSERKHLKNIYERFLSSSLAVEGGYRPDFYFDTDLYEDCAGQAVVEKYPASEVNLIGELNNLIFANLEAEEESHKKWIDVNSDGFVELTFRMPEPEESNWARLIADNGADTVFMSILDQMHVGQATEEGQQIYDTLYAYNLEMSVLDEESPNQQDDFYTTPNEDKYYSPNEKTVFDYRPRKLDHPFTYMIEWLQEEFPIQQTPTEDRIKLNKFFPIKDFPLMFEDSNLLLSAPGRNEFIHRMNRAASNSKGDFWIQMYPEEGPRPIFPARTMRGKNIFESKLCPSEIVAFRVEKKNILTQQVLKEFYFFNNPETTDFTFIDNEVSIGGRYKYNIYAINLVAGLHYSYTNVSEISDNRTGRGADGRIFPSVLFELQISPFHKVVETPFFSQDVVFVDLPPVHPSVRLYKMSPDTAPEAIFRCVFESRIDHTEEVPMAIRPGDEKLISEMITAQSFLTQSATSKLKYSSDTKPTHFEMMVLETAPMSYHDFETADYYETPFSMPYFNFVAPENKDRYMIFRTRDKGGVSNPGHMFRFRFNKYGDGSYYEFEIYEPDEELSIPTMTCERYLSIRPALSQSAYNFGTEGAQTQEELAEMLETAPAIDSISVGLANEELSIWGRKFKIRLRSRSTGRMIDFNFDYALEMIDDTAQDRRDAFQQRREATCEEEAIIKNENIDNKITNSRQRISSRSTNSAQSTPGSNTGNAGSDY